MRYLLDSDSLIAAKNLYYRPSFCQAFWNWIADGHNFNRVFSIDRVYNELRSGDQADFLNNWSNQINANSSFFLSSSGCMKQWGKVSKWADGRGFKESALDKFLEPRAADAWLIAFALKQRDEQGENYTIVTNEVSAPNSKNSVKLPDAAKAMGIQVVNLFDLLTLHAGQHFNYKNA